MTLGQQIRQKRDEHHITQEELAEQMQVSRQAVAKWEADRSCPSPENRLLLAELLCLEDVDAPPGPPPRRRVRGALCIAGWCLALLLAAALVLARATRPSAEATALTGVYLYDGQGRQLAPEANWYPVGADCTVIVTYTGTPDAVALYLTPAGSETAGDRQQLAVYPITEHTGFVLFRPAFPVSLSGHLQAALETGGASEFSELYNVYMPVG